LFHKVRDEMGDTVSQHVAHSHEVIAVGPQCLRDFRNESKTWLDSLRRQRNLIALACGYKNDMPENEIPIKYSYDRGELNEFEVQNLLLDAKDMLHEVPGYQHTKHTKKVQTLKAKKQQVNLKKPVIILGPKTLLSEKKKFHASHLSDSEAQFSESSADECATARTTTTTQTQSSARGRKKQIGMASWTKRVETDRAERKDDPEYNSEERIFDNLYWVLKVKSEIYWQKPLQDMVDKLVEDCTDEQIVLNIETKNELSKLTGVLSQTYTIRDEIEFGSTKATKVKVPVKARLVPMGSLEGADLHQTETLENMENMKLPLKIVIAHEKENVTIVKTQKMKNSYHHYMEQAVVYMTSIINSIENFFIEVEEDLQMACSLEGRVPYPPNSSHLFLKHCDGRELQPDSLTPRSNERDSEDELVESKPDTPKATSQTVSFEAGVKAVNRIERYHVLNKVHTAAKVRSKGYGAKK
jgi:hypothetical protein